MYNIAWLTKKLDCFTNAKDKQFSLFCCFICEEEKRLSVNAILLFFFAY
jgi:hypothetical protein